MTTGSFLAGAHQELSVALIKCQGSVYRGCANLLAKAAGRQVSPGAEVPYEDCRRSGRGSIGGLLPCAARCVVGLRW